MENFNSKFWIKKSCINEFEMLIRWQILKSHQNLCQFFKKTDSFSSTTTDWYFLLNFALQSSTLIIKWNTFPFSSKFFILYFISSCDVCESFSPFNFRNLFSFQRWAFLLLLTFKACWIFFYLFVNSKTELFYFFLHYFPFWNVNKSFVRIK